MRMDLQHPRPTTLRQSSQYTFRARLRNIETGHRNGCHTSWAPAMHVHPGDTTWTETRENKYRTPLLVQLYTPTKSCLALGNSHSSAVKQLTCLWNNALNENNAQCTRQSQSSNLRNNATMHKRKMQSQSSNTPSDIIYNYNCTTVQSKGNGQHGRMQARRRQ